MVSGPCRAEVLLSGACGRTVRRGDYVEARVDLVLANELSASRAIDVFEKGFRADRIFTPARVVVVPDHFTPNKDIRTAELTMRVREFVLRHGIGNYFEVGRGGIEHVLLPLEGLVHPLDVVVGGDSHTCTYGALGAFACGVGATDVARVWFDGRCWFRVPPPLRVELRGALGEGVCGKDVILSLIGFIGVDGAVYRSIEFHGGGVGALSIFDRFTIANMCVEAGAKCGVFPVDGEVFGFLEEWTPLGEDRVAGLKERVEEEAGRHPVLVEYELPRGESADVTLDLGRIEPVVAEPFLPSNTVPASALSGVAVDQVVIGCCTNGWLKDLEEAALILDGVREVHPRVRAIVIPGTRRVMLEAARRGILEKFVASGAVVCPPSCGPCLGGHLGVLGPGEVAVATTNRNFVGRMGHKESRVYLASPLTAAAAAVSGKIVDPRSML